MMTHCPLTGVCLKHFMITLLAGFIFIVAYNYFINAVFLTNLYEQTPQLWRTPDDMQGKIWFVWVMQFLIVLITALIFTRNYEARGLGEGMRYGLMIGALLGVDMASSYAWMPIPAALAGAWFLAGLLEGLGLGAIYALAYRDKRVCDLTPVKHETLAH